MKKELKLSVIICTYNRANFLKQVLESLTNQTLPQECFEIIIIDDGSCDETQDVVDVLTEKLPITYFYQNNAGLASAKNHGTYAARGKIVLFLDDDDITTPTFLEEHLKTHERYPMDNYAVLNYTDWSPDLHVTALMHFITKIGCFLFSYPYINHGEILGYKNFWGGRSSCKRAFLMEHGVFNPIYRFGCEDIELGYRLSKHKLKVIYNSKAISLMVRPINFDDFCSRLIKQGRSQYVFSSMHCDPEILTYTEMDEFEDKWPKIKHLYLAKINSARELDKIANMKQKYGFDIDETTKNLLHEAYRWAFKACKFKGIEEKRKSSK